MGAPKRVSMGAPKRAPFHRGPYGSLKGLEGTPKEAQKGPLRGPLGIPKRAYRGLLIGPVGGP